MAVIKSVSSLQASKLLKILDYYYWKGLLCVRVLPTSVHQPGSPPQLQTWAALRNAKIDWRILKSTDKNHYKLLVQTGPRTGHDWYMKGYLLSSPRFPRGVPAIYNIKTIAAGPWILVQCDTTQPSLPYLLYGFSDTPLRSAFTHWQPSTYYTRGAKFRRRWTLRLTFPDFVQSAPAIPRLHHEFKVPTPPIRIPLEYMIALAPPPQTPELLTSGLIRHV